MILSEVLFSFGGRINRAKFWLGFLVYWLLERVLYAASIPQAGALKWPDQISVSTVIPSFVAFLDDVIPFLAWVIVPTWCLLAIVTKRLHDRRKSGLWMLVFFLGTQDTVKQLDRLYHDWPTWIATDLSIAKIAILLWALIELGFLRGTTGANQYGESPLVPSESITTPALQV
jgi:uncharacterized membrane protein YhaH (DUF805 family)